MIGLRTARAVVIDDNPLEAMPIIHALGRHGVGAVYVRGDKVEELPKPKLKGIRLVFLDMKLDIEGEDKEIVSKAVNVLNNVIHEDASPNVIVIWTKHSELVNAFKKKLLDVMPNLRPGIILSLNKPFDYEHREWPTTMLRTFGTVQKVEKTLRKHTPLDLLWYWEQCVHDATTEATGTLADLVASSDSGDGSAHASVVSWVNGIKELLGAVVNGVGGATIVDGHSSLQAMFAGMSPFVSDRILHLTHESKALVRNARCVADQSRAERAKNTKKKSFLSGAQRARLNKMFLLAPPEKKPRVSHVPGELYLKTLWADSSEIAFPIGRNGVSRSTLVGEAVNLPSLESSDSEQAKAARTLRRAILRKCQTCLLEFTPPCDFSQQKAKMARLIAGVIVPANGQIKLRSSGHYLKRLGLVEVDKTDGFLFTGPAYLVLNARYVFGISIAQIKKQQAVCRVREEALSDVCAWFANHASRPGLLMVY